MGKGNRRGRGQSANGTGWHDDDSTYWKSSRREGGVKDAGAAAYTHNAPPQVQAPWLRPLPAQWRFVCRVLKRHGPEEKVQDIKNQVHVGDHVVLHYGWDFSELHGIVCSGGQDGHGRRRGDRQELQVIHWDGSKLHSLPLSQFISKDGELVRIVYPHWACQCIVPSTPTLRMQVLQEWLLEAQADDAVAKASSSAHRNGSWSPRWSQAADLEFCIAMKTGGRDLLWEIHARKTAASMLLVPLGCTISGERPSVQFGLPRSGCTGSSGPLFNAAQPGFQATSQWAGFAQACGANQQPQLATAGELDAYQCQAVGGYGQEVAWGGNWWDAGGWYGYAREPPWGASTQDMQQACMQQVSLASATSSTNAQLSLAESTLSANAHVFVPN
mmetsp:Transcript_136408/g.272060  ORF Transcript_136408/g.272060 Transcript_136408/m.272060 type:complete len:386 (+) Transcript_136408:33-1190(+)